MAGTLLDGLIELYVAMLAGLLAGKILARRSLRQPGERVLGRVVLLVLTPVLVFTSLVNADIALDPVLVISIVIVQQVTSLSMMGLAYVGLKGKRIPDPKLGGFLLVAGFPNATIFPLPIVIAAFGPAYVAIIVLFSASELVLRGTLGTFLAMKLGAPPVVTGEATPSRGFSARASLKSFLLFPPTIAIILAAIWIPLGLPVPREALDLVKGPLSKIVSWLGAAMIGMVLSGLDKSMFSTFKTDIPGSMVLRFVLPCVVYLPLAFLLPFEMDPVIVKTILLLEVMGPPAVMNAIYAVTFHLDKVFVSSMVAVLTLAMAVLAPVIVLAGPLVFGP